MTDQPDDSPTGAGPPARRRRLLWRLVVPLVLAFAGFLFATSAQSAEGIDLRPDGSTGLNELVTNQSDRAERLHGQVAKLQEEINQLSDVAIGGSDRELARKLDELRAAAGYSELTGLGVEVVMDDAPYDQPIPEGYTANDVVVHQQDLQAVVNALWEAGAEGITLQGQRLTSSTGIKCVGNTVQLYGVPYSPPYKIVAVGDPPDLISGLNSDDYIKIYKQYTQPPFNIGWELKVLDAPVTLPAAETAPDLSYARPM